MEKLKKLAEEHGWDPLDLRQDEQGNLTATFKRAKRECLRLYGNYIAKPGEETTPEYIAVLAKDMAICMEELGKTNPGSTVEEAEIIIKPDSVGWKVAIRAANQNTHD